MKNLNCEMNMEMTKYKLGDLCTEFHSGKGIRAVDISEDGIYPVFGGNGLRGYTSSYNQDGTYLIIGRQGAYCGNVRYNVGKAFLTEHAIVGQTKDEHNAIYLAFKLSLMNLAQFQGQSAQPGLSVDTLSKIELLMHSKQEQDKIAKVLVDLDDKIALNKKMNQKLEVMAKRLYDHWFVQFDFPDENGRPYKTSGGPMTHNETLNREIPEGWVVKTLGEYLDCNKYSLTTRSSCDFIQYLDTSSLTENALESLQRYKSLAESPSRAKRIVHANDILYSTVRPQQKHYGIVKNPVQNMIASTGFAILSCKYGVEYNDMFYLFLIQEKNLNKLSAIADSNASSYPSFNPSDLLNLTICLPNNLEIIGPLVKKFSSLFSIIERNQKENKKLTSLRDKLLPLLMNGQVTVA